MSEDVFIEIEEPELKDILNELQKRLQQQNSLFKFFCEQN